MKIIQARPQDKQRIVSLVNEAYWCKQKPFFVDTPASYERLNEEQLTQLMQSKDHRIFLLVDGDQILGVIVLELPNTEEYARFGLFAIDIRYSRKKLGHLLIQYAEDYAFKKGKKLMKIDVFAFATELANYYLDLGYTFSGKTTGFFHDECIKPEYQNNEKVYLVEMIKTLRKE